MAKIKTLLFLLAILVPASEAASITPSRLEANLGILPIDIYTTPQFTDIFPGASCHTVGGTTPQTCVRQFLASFKAQGATGVRFQFSVGNGQWSASPSTGPFYSSYSTPFTSTGTLNLGWYFNIAAFFADVKAAGINNVTPFTVLSYYWAGWNNPTFQTTSVLVDVCTGTAQTFYFYPWLPFGLAIPPGSAVPGWPDQDINNAYNCAQANPTFWGWTPYLGLINEIASAASSTGLTIEEVEIEGELNLWDFTVTARLIYDNTTGTPVRTNVGSVLASWGFPAGAATYSASASNPSGIDPMTGLPERCGSVYGDSAYQLTLSELLAGTGGGLIGRAFSPSFTLGLWCGGTAPIGWMTPVPAQSLWTVSDSHVYPCLGACSTSPSVVTTASQIYSDLEAFHVSRGLTGNLKMVGETSSNSPPTYGCDDTTSTEAFDNASGYVASTLYSSFKSSTVLRPWTWASSVAPLLCQTPGNIGLPSGPYLP